MRRSTHVALPCFLSLGMIMKATGHWFVIVALTVAAAGCGAEGEETEGHGDEITERPDCVAWATPEWSGRKTWYTTAQGSFLTEDDIFMALERDVRPAKPGEKLFVFDTAKAGNTARGHTYGTDLSASGRMLSSSI